MRVPDENNDAENVLSFFLLLFFFLLFFFLWGGWVILSDMSSKVDSSCHSPNPADLCLLHDGLPLYCSKVQFRFHHYCQKKKKKKRKQKRTKRQRR